MEQPVFSFGIIADVQYADIDNGQNFSKTRVRYYRNALDSVKDAGKVWTERKVPVQFILNLGDVIDGKNKPINASKSAMDTIVREMNALGKPVYHTWGNHEFYNFSRKDLLQTPLFCGTLPDVQGSADCAYYYFHAHRRLLIANLDCYEKSVLGYDTSGDSYEEAKSLLLKRNPNVDKNDPGGLLGEERRFTAYNGGVSPKQLQWLHDTLQSAVTNKINVIVMGHIPLLEAAGGWSETLWNYDEVLPLFEQYKECVVCYLCGHTHEAGSGIDNSGILHITMPAVVETTPGNRAFSTADVFTDKIQIKGEGTAESFDIKMKYNLS